ncbi:signal peptide peptidase-like 2B [Rhineura floridana]|uniref:signal peptide peptidase-like 2B n=1 Tax=Rhineura floridana TaxID=261503 RepID=UPI002AC86C51|nr:signal peptide peptidase-like 2B [Rhineura floridana]
MKETCGMAMVLFLANLFLLFIPPVLAQNPGVIHISPEKGGDYCFLFPSQWMKSHQDSRKNCWLDPELRTQNMTYSAMCCPPSFFGEEDNDGGGFSTRIASVREGNCNLFENARLHQINGTQGLLTLGGDAPYPMRNWKSGYNWGHCEEITIPGILLKDMDILYLLFKNLIRDLLYKTGIIYVMSMCIVIIGSYWAGSRERKKQLYVERQCHTEDDFNEVTIDTNVYFTCTCTAMATIMLLALYCFYDYLVHAMIGIFCLYASFSLYGCLAPFVSKLPFGKHVIHFPYFHKGLEIKTLFLAVLSMSINAIWVIFRNEDGWGWVLQDILGISIGIYILRTVHMPTLKNCSLFLLAHLFYDVLCLFATPYLTKAGKSITDMTAYGSSDSEEMPFLLKVPILPSTSILDYGSFTAVGLGDIILPGFLVAYCHRFDVQVNSSGIYFLASTLAYSYGLLVTFVAATFLQTSQSTLLYMVPCILITTMAVAASRQEVVLFWTGVGSAEDLSQPYLQKVTKHPNTFKNSEGQLCQEGAGKPIVNITFHREELNSFSISTREMSDLDMDTEEMTKCIPSPKEPDTQHEAYQKEEA